MADLTPERLVNIRARHGATERRHPKMCIAITAIWLRRVGTDTQVLVESHGQWFLAIVEPADGCYSHIAEARGIDRWPHEG